MADLSTQRKRSFRDPPTAIDCGLSAKLLCLSDGVNGNLPFKTDSTGKEAVLSNPRSVMGESYCACQPHEAHYLTAPRGPYMTRKDPDIMFLQITSSRRMMGLTFPVMAFSIFGLFLKTEAQETTRPLRGTQASTSSQTPQTPTVTQNGTPQVQLKMAEGMEPILQEWEKKTAGIETLHGTFRRYIYDHIFMVEKRATGQYWFGSPDKARMDFHPDSDVPKAPENKHEIAGKVYDVVADEQKSWICTGEEILEVRHTDKTFDRMEIPAQFQGQRITDGPMPFLFGMKADSVKKRYVMNFGDRHDPQSQIHIVAFPLTPALRREFQRAEILLDPNTFQPQAVKLWDPAGSTETVYLFYSGKPFNLADRLKGPWSVYLGPPWKKVNDFKADPDQLPMQAPRQTSSPSAEQSAFGASPFQSN